ncbi:Uncharacterised protein [Staphylococcus aureus]|nr:Uncharacterised protein [Staphylococcus aureus]
MTISPTENGALLLIKIALISDPSKDPPYRITRPTPKPIIAPPKIVTKNASLIKGSK